MNFWDERYQDPEYVYGQQANDFLKQNMHLLPRGKVLSLAEGEGRNAVFLAEQGYAVTAVDSSEIGREKALALAASREVEIDYVLADLADYEPGAEQWDVIVSIFCPLPSEIRHRVHGKMCEALKPGGVFLLESYTPQQIDNDTGGGKDPDALQSAQTLRTDFPSLTFDYLFEGERRVVEGKYHTGQANVVQMLASK